MTIMKSIYFATSYSKRSEFRDIYDLLTSAGYIVMAPIYDYVGKTDDFQALMQHSFDLIDKCDLVVADITYKEIGVGIEIGYARAKGKMTVYLRKEGSEVSTTSQGTANVSFEYMPNQLSEILDVLAKM